jgi:iron complex outermembrane receptor protein/vitamin B12 transporter
MKTNLLNKNIELLHAGGYSCVISKGEETRTFTKSGIMDLFELLENDPTFLNASLVADKVVGKAAATLMILGGVSHIYADVISEPAITLINNAKIEIQFGKSVPLIENRDKSGVCPLEKKCMNSNSLQELSILIREFINTVRR